jgi:TPR repeat protein
MNGGDVVSLELEKEPNPSAIKHARALLATNRESGRSELRKLATSGSAMSAYFLALSDRTETVPTLPLDDVSEFWLKEAGNLGCNLACYRLGWLYMRAKRHQEAIAAFRRGVDAGYPPAFRMLAVFYKKGLGVPSDVKAARELLETGATLGSLRARSSLAWLLMQEKFGLYQKVRGALLLIGSALIGVGVCKKYGIYSVRLV